MFEDDHDDVDVCDDRGEGRPSRSFRSVTRLAPGGVENCFSQDHLEVHMLLISKQTGRPAGRLQRESISQTCFEILPSDQFSARLSTGLGLFFSFRATQVVGEPSREWRPMSSPLHF